MKRPNKEDFRGKNLMNGPYNQVAYAESLEKYIDYLEGGAKKKKAFKTYDNTILVLGKKYRWSGYSSGLYVDTSWKNVKCKITKIDKDVVCVYDYSDNKEWSFSGDDLKRNMVKFKKIKIWK